MNEPTHIDLFSGIGGFSIAFERAGFRTIGFAEIDPYASAVLRKHWPSVPNYGDVRNVPAVDCDVLTGGFPCQPFSVAGKRQGKADNRFLWPAMLDVIARCRPAWIVGENVPGIIGMELDACCADLENAGYAVQPIVVPALAVDARHRRDRVWILAYSERAERWPDDETGGNYCQRQDRERQAPSGSRECGETVANPNSSDRHGGAGNVQVGRIGRSQKTALNGDSSGAKWLPEPNVGRVANGVSNRVDRLKCLGNAIVPQVAEVIARNIKAIIDTETHFDRRR